MNTFILVCLHSIFFCLFMDGPVFAKPSPENDVHFHVNMGHVNRGAQDGQAATAERDNEHGVDYSDDEDGKKCNRSSKKNCKKPFICMAKKKKHGEEIKGKLVYHCKKPGKFGEICMFDRYEIECEDD